MTTPIRVVHIVVITILAFVARWLHEEYRSPVTGSEGTLRYLWLGLLFAMVAAVMASPPRTTRLTATVISATNVALIGLGAAAMSQLFFPNSLPRFTVVATAGFTFVWLLATGTLVVLNRRRLGIADRVLAVVSPTDAEALADEVGDEQAGQRFLVVATITSEDDYDSITERAESTRATELVLGKRAVLSPVVLAHAEELHQAGLRVRSVDSFYDQRLGKLPLSSLDSFALMGDVESLHGGYAPVKRAIDLVLASLGTIVLGLLLPVILLGNLIGNRGPLLFRQERAGLFGEPFSIFKLRTMTPGAVDISGWTSNNDPRITAFGKILRRTHIDELPQVVNILLGDLSVVGPRPEQVSYVRKLEKSLPFYSARHLVHPGLTGWAQVKYPYAASEEDAYVKLQYDLHYVRHESFSTDMRIIVLTIKHLLVDGGR